MTQVMEEEKVRESVVELLHPVMHIKRAESIGLAVVGAMRSDRLSSSGIGMAMAATRGTSAKHGIKQVDRLLGNKKFIVRDFFRAHVPWILGAREEALVSLDWTEYASDGHSRIAINLVTGHGRATPLIWKTVESSSLKDRRNAYEDDLLHLLATLVPDQVQVTVVADRGFGDEKLYRFLGDELGFDFIIRFRGVIHVEDRDGNKHRAKDRVPPNGRIRELPGAKVTHQGTPVGAVVLVKKKGMKEDWCLATSLVGQKERVVALYGRRFTCEENFRDEKDDRFGLGFKETRVSTCERRDRFLVICTLATVLLTLLGAAGEELGLDRHLKSNTTKRRIHSLFRQGREYLRDIFNMHAEALRYLAWKLFEKHRFKSEVFGLI